MKKLIIYFLLFFQFESVSSQSDSISVNKYLSLVCGIKYYSSPIYYGKTNGSRYAFYNYNEKKVISGPRIKIGLDYLIEKVNIRIQYSNSIKYGHLYYSQTDTNISYMGASTVNYSENAFTFEQNIHVNKSFSFQRYSVNVGLGYSWMNFGSEYSYLYHINANSYMIIIKDFKYKGWEVSSSLTFKRIEYKIGLLLVDWEDHSFINKKSMLIPNASINYFFNVIK